MNDLVKRLRDKETAHLPGGYRLCAEAADALEQMERDFREYIGTQVKKTMGVYACCYCKNRNSPEIWAIGCQHKDCDGVSEWEWGNRRGRGGRVMASFLDGHGGYCTCTRDKCTDDCATYRRFKPKPMTNGDRIRAMTDEELADELLTAFAAFYEVEWSKDAVLDWLKQEAT